MFVSFLTPNMAVSKSFRRGDVIYNTGDKPQGIYFVQSGLVGLTIVGPSSGKEHLLRFFKKDQFFGHRTLFAGSDQEFYHGTTTVLETTSILFYPKDVVLNLLEKNPSLYKEVLAVLSKELRRCEELHVMILENQILPRVAQTLVYLKETSPEHPWTRQEIANFCASTTSTVIKAMADLEALKLIRQNGRTFEIVSREGLLNLPDLNYIKLIGTNK